MSSLGSQAVSLLRHLSYNRNDPLPPYRLDIVNQVLGEMQYLYEENQRDLQAAESDEERQELFAVVRVRHSALLWNKRCLLAYHQNRLMRLKEVRWQLGAVLPEDIRKNLAPYEIRWFMHYCENVGDYMSKLNQGRGMDLTMYKSAPKSLYVQVRCLTNYGDFELDDGSSVVLSSGSMHYLPLVQCEKLLRQGILEQIE